jgi:hypothetical protein
MILALLLGVAPAQTGAHPSTACVLEQWTPAFAGMKTLDQKKSA